MFDPDKVETAEYIVFTAVDDVSQVFKDPRNPIGYMKIKLVSGEEVTLGVGVLAAFGIQMSFPVLLQAAKTAREMNNANPQGL